MTITNAQLTDLLADARAAAKHPGDRDFVAEITRHHVRDNLGCLEVDEVETLEDIAAAAGYRRPGVVAVPFIGRAQLEDVNNNA